MKIILYRWLPALMGIVVFAAGCRDITSEDTSVITYYVTFEMNGSPVETVALGTPYVEPGVSAFENGVDVTASMQISGTVDSDEAGVYFITYSAANQDGFSNSTERMVVVFDPDETDLETDLSGEYLADEGTHRLAAASGAVVSYSGYPVVLTRIAPGIFSVSDFFGGYYDKRAGYGRNYAMTGYITLNKDNTLSLLYSHVNGWGDSLDEMNDATCDAATGTIRWGAVYAGAYSFNLVLTEN